MPIGRLPLLSRSLSSPPELWYRRNWRSLLWISVIIGIITQIVLICTDAFATQVFIPVLDTNPYYRTLGWSAFARTVGELAHKQATPTIVSDVRAEVASAAILLARRTRTDPGLADCRTHELRTHPRAFRCNRAAYSVHHRMRCAGTHREILFQGHAAGLLRPASFGGQAVFCIQARRRARRNRTYQSMLVVTAASHTHIPAITRVFSECRGVSCGFNSFSIWQ